MEELDGVFGRADGLDEIKGVRRCGGIAVPVRKGKEVETGLLLEGMRIYGRRIGWNVGLDLNGRGEEFGSFIPRRSQLKERVVGE